MKEERIRKYFFEQITFVFDSSDVSSESVVLAGLELGEQLLDGLTHVR